ncbi:helix-turn-helix domain-containing protein [Micromonospora sagamiensis]|uniref:DNA-binding transcriptional ArsR family regulator n=1 Tax=Micromonospora sagamiensis TaxID=47875 RepID=A0A562WH29_9ACTN|nr:helix-turn-helix domain-containing protein [Micromonospora sagamiensis]TWJ29620.1 DNA-binding transcriptional ArsR family regulator [Micromonospora sagamiensis]BCL17350.1 transcriptional regulator [Micromonospora sagamiensis]
MIDVRLDASALAQVRLSVSPAFEAIAWLRLAANGRHHPVYGDPGPAARLALRDRDVALVAQTLLPGGNGGYTLDLLTPKPWIGPVASILDRQLGVMTETPPDVVAYQLCPGRFPVGRMPVDVRTAMEDGTFAGRAADGLLRFWRTVFAELWPGVRSTLETDLAARATVIGAAGIGRMLGTLHRDLDWTGSHLSVGTTAYQEIFDLDGAELVLCPTAVGWPQLAAQCCDPSDAVLVYPANGLVPTRPAPDSGLPELVGSSRAAILRDLGVARSTHELSTRWRLAPATVSYHLGVLLRSGLVSRRRDRRVVFYHRTEQGDAVLGLRDSVLQK